MPTVKTLGPLPAPAWHRPWFRYFAPVDGAEAGTPTPPAPVPAPPATPPAPSPKADEPLGEKGLAALQAERDARSTAERELAAARQKLQEIEDAGKTEQQRVDDELAAKKAEIAQLTLAKTRAEVAAAKGVPVELLSGTTQAEVEASADALLKFKGPTEPAAPQRYVVPDEGGKPALGKTESTRPGIGTLRAAYEENEGK